VKAALFWNSRFLMGYLDSKSFDFNPDIILFAPGFFKIGIRDDPIYGKHLYGNLIDVFNQRCASNAGSYRDDAGDRYWRD
jgi:hypothetical protein